MRVTWIKLVVIASLAAGSLSTYSIPAQQARQAAAGGVEDRLQRLEDREAIRGLFIEYGRTLDSRDFTSFGQLFAKDGEFIGGGGASSSAKGPEAVGALLERMIGTNYPDSKGKNFHLFFGELIQVNGNEATAVSKGGFVMANSTNKPDLLLLATYHDQFVREDGRWKFKRRQIQSDIPVPKAAAR
jgi:hypothetical protein